MTDRLPLRIPAPDPGPEVTETTLRLLETIIRRHDVLAGESLDLYFKATGGALSRYDIRLAEASVLALAQIVRRIDADAASYLEEDILPRLRLARTNLPLGTGSSVAASEAAVDAVSVVEGALEAAYIDGPAQGATAVHVTAIAASQAQAEAEATASAFAEAAIPAIELFLVSAQEADVDADVLAEIEELRDAVEAGDSKSTLIPRFIRIADAVRSVASLGEALLRLGATIFG